MEQSDSRDAVNRMKEYINKHIFETITLKELALEAGYSMYHAAHIFKEVVGKAPFEYIRSQRLVASAYSLRKSDKRVIDIAFDHMFSSHEGYTRAFSKAFGISPKRFSRMLQPKDWLIPYKMIHYPEKMEELNMTQKTVIIFTQIVERPARKLLMKRGIKASDYYEYCEEVGCNNTIHSDPWEVLSKIKEALNEPAGCWLPKSMIKPGTSEYVHAVEVPIDYKGTIPEGFDLIDLAPCKMLVFQGEPYDDSVFEDAIGALWERIEKFNPEVYGYEYDYDSAPRMQLEPQGWRGYIELYPIREKK
jgi:AraC family transcriptional regulator